MTYDQWKLRSDRDDDWWNEEPDEVPDMVYLRRLLQWRDTPMDIADLADELEALVQEAIAAGIALDDIGATLAAKLDELKAGQEGNDNTGEGEEDTGEEGEDA
jgi:hypothetical protein